MNLKQLTLLKPIVRKTISLFLLQLVFNVNCFSQMSFFIKPSIFIKTDQHRLIDTDFYNPKYLPTSYFTYYNPGIVFIPNLNFGIDVGITIKEKHFLDFGISSESTGIKRAFIFPNDIQNEVDGIGNLYPANISTGWVGGYFMKFNLDYYYRFLKTKNNALAIRFIGGIGLFFNKDITKYDYPVSSYDLYNSSFDQPDKNIYLISHTYEYADIRRVSPYINLGFGFDFATKKKRNLFSIDISYIHNFLYIVTGSHVITLIDNGVKKAINIDEGGRGSGFHFQISRRFQLYPWTPLSKKKHQKVSIL